MRSVEEKLENVLSYLKEMILHPKLLKKFQETGTVQNVIQSVYHRSGCSPDDFATIPKIWLKL